MHKPRLTIIILVLLSVGCASYSELKKMDKFGDITEAYGFSIRWSDFDSAAAFIRDPEKNNYSPPDVSKLERVKVTDYIVKKTAVSKDETQVVQIVKITYYKIDNLIVTSINDRQLWKWDSAEKYWYLESGLPDFK